MSKLCSKFVNEERGVKNPQKNPEWSQNSILKGLIKEILYRHGQPNPDSHSTMRVWIWLHMSVYSSYIWKCLEEGTKGQSNFQSKMKNSQTKTTIFCKDKNLPRKTELQHLHIVTIDRQFLRHWDQKCLFPIGRNLQLIQQSWIGH